MAASLRVAGLVPRPARRPRRGTTGQPARWCPPPAHAGLQRQGHRDQGRNSTPRTVNCPAADSAAKRPQPAGDRDQAALQRGRLEHDRRRDTAAGQNVMHQVVVERRVERPREQDDRLVGEMPSPDGAQPWPAGAAPGMATWTNRWCRGGRPGCRRWRRPGARRPRPRRAARAARCAGLPTTVSRATEGNRSRKIRTASGTDAGQPGRIPCRSLVMPSPASRAAWTA